VGCMRAVCTLFPSLQGCTVGILLYLAGSSLGRMGLSVLHKRIWGKIAGSRSELGTVRMVVHRSSMELRHSVGTEELGYQPVVADFVHQVAADLERWALGCILRRKRHPDSSLQSNLSAEVRRSPGRVQSRSISCRAQSVRTEGRKACRNHRGACTRSMVQWVWVRCHRPIQ